MKLYYLILTPALFVSLNLKAQSETNVRISEGGYGIVKTNITVTYDHTFGRVTDGFNARVSYEFLKKKHFTVSGNLKYNSVTVNFHQSDLDKNFNPDEIDLNGIHTMEQIGITATSNTSLFGKPVIALGMLNSEWGKGGFNRVSATLMAMLMIRTNRDTQFGIGVLGMINTTSKVPVFPVFVYRHRFNKIWFLNLYGGMFGVDYTPTANDLISIGGDIDVKSFYFRPSSNDLPKTCRYTQTNCRPMLKYRRRLIPNLYFNVQGGYALNMNSRVNGVNGIKEYITISQKPHLFFQTSISYSL